MNTTLTTSIEKLLNHKLLTKEEFVVILEHNSESLRKQLAAEATRLRMFHFGNDIYIRGLIEVSNYCKNDCLYCGIRKSNSSCERYRLTMEEILSCCEEGYTLGFRTFVLQGGEDAYYNDQRLTEIVSHIRENYPDCAITLSFGERSRESYEALFHAGANRYLLRHETANSSHYAKLHPSHMSHANRMKCLEDLKELGYQVGCGFMVGSPYQTKEHLAEDLLYIQEFQPHMVGIGPFLSHRDTPFANQPNGSFEDTLLLLSILRIMIPTLLLPATTALGTIHPKGRELGILAGANVVMPNLSPVAIRDKYTLYDNKICTGEESAQCISCLKNRLEQIHCNIAIHRGDSPNL